MKKLTMICLAAALVCMGSLAVLAADATGTWKSSFETPRGTFEQTFVLKQDGDKLTGKVVTQRGETEITDGKVTGDDIEFTVKRKRQNGEEFVSTYKVKVNGDKLVGTMQMGDRGSRDFTATRDKQ